MNFIMTFSVLPAVLLGLFQVVLTENSHPLVSTPLGKYEGSLLNTSLGKPIFSFRGIRYAEAPINELRFKPPVPVKKHAGVYNAKEDGPVCPQPTKDPVSEDCLLLNVYTTKLPDGKNNPKRPVIVYLHYGGFYFSSGRSNNFGPQYFMNQEVVLVTLNYRLGALGFLSTGDKEAIGNNGLKDQVMALKWVKANIEAFGGDPNSVTIYGCSAGAMSVTLHLVSPMSKGLFHKGVISSSSDLGNFPIGRNQLDVAKRQAKAVGCSDDTTANIVKCLKGKSAEELGKSLSKVFEIGSQPVLLWKPVVEQDFGQERFLTDHPVKLIREGKFQSVPILAGITTEEFGFVAPLLLKEENLVQMFNNEWEKYAPIFFLYERNTERSKTISRGLRSFYFGDKKIDNSTVVQLANLFNEAQTGFAVNRAVKLMAQYSKEPVYYYRFSYKGKYSFHYTPESNGTVPFGTIHQDDLIYLFYLPDISPQFGKHDIEFRTVEKLTTLWSNFAKNGKPIVETCGRLDFADWPAYNLKTQKYLDIGEVLTPKEKLYEDRYAEWDKLFPASQAQTLDISELFHKGIISGPTDIGNFPIGRHQLDVTKRQAEIVGCPVDTTADLVKCLKGKSAEELGNSLPKLYEIEREPILLWRPTVELDFGQERFLTDHPAKLIREGKFNHVPLLAGITKEEFDYASPLLLRNEKLLPKLNEEFQTYAPIFFLYERNTNRSKAISKGLKSFYFDDKKIDNSSEIQLAQLYSDSRTGFGVNRAVKLMAEYSKESVYYYRFSYKGRYSFNYVPESNGTVPYGTVHQDDLIYLLYLPSVSPQFGKQDKEFRTVEKLTTLWSNFASNGKPIVKTCGRLDYAEWPVFDLKTQKYLDIDEILTVKEKLDNDRYAEWEKLFPVSKADVLDISY